ncbi:MULTISPECIES: hypothetical protein, partial [unclassified Bosea (in: a-proteobacteria)]|uniref:hypothetical protein n=1 Tax=unclassified Bosea (in: a-proteobacteria) TaxID=2653178 RepID=UPI001AEDE846
HVDLAQLRDDLFRLVLLLRHRGILQRLKKPTSARATFQGAGQFCIIVHMLPQLIYGDPNACSNYRVKRESFTVLCELCDETG